MEIIFFILGRQSGNSKDDRVSGISASSLDGQGMNWCNFATPGFGIDSRHLFFADDERRLVSAPLTPTKL